MMNWETHQVSSVFSFYSIFLVLVGNSWISEGIPINGANGYTEHNGNQYYSNPQRTAPGQQSHLPNLNHGPEVEEFQRLPTNQRIHQRKTGPQSSPPDVERVPPAGFHQTQAEQINRPNFRHYEIDDSFPQNHYQQQHFHNDFRQQSPPHFARMQNDDFQDFQRRSQGPPNSPVTGQNKPELNNHYPYEGHRFTPIPNQPYFQGEKEKNAYAKHTQNGYKNSFPQDVKPPMGYWRDQEPTQQHEKSFNSAKIPDLTASHGKPPTGSGSPPVPHSAPAAVNSNPAVNGNSTLSIEYDISDKAEHVTYETIMEVDDGADSSSPGVATNTIL